MLRPTPTSLTPWRLAAVSPEEEAPPSWHCIESLPPGVLSLPGFITAHLGRSGLTRSPGPATSMVMLWAPTV